MDNKTQTIIEKFKKNPAMAQAVLQSGDGQKLMQMLTAQDGGAAEPEILGEEDGPDGRRTLIRAGAGMRMPRLLSWSAAHDLAGLEGLVGVPGRVGGAVAMNAGAYGCSTAPLMRSLDVFTPEQGLHTLTPDGWKATYRHFSLIEDASWYMSVSVVLSLRQAAPGSVRAAMKENFLRKKSGQPVHEHTAKKIRNPSRCIRRAACSRTRRASPRESFWMKRA